MPFPIRIRDIMSSPVQTTSPDTTARDAASMCFEQEIGSLVITEDDEIVGIVTTMDLVKLLGTTDEPGSQLVREVMSSPVVTTSPRTPVNQAVEKMSEYGINRLVVSEEEELVGLVSTDDITRYIPQAFHRGELDYERRDESPQFSVRQETAYEKSDWETECVTVSEDELSIGDRVEFSKTISEQDVRTFAAASGDTNRLHLTDEYAAETRFGRRIVHGTLVSGLISAALARLPGLTIYVSQDLSFLSAVDIGKRVSASVEVIGTFGRDKYELTTDVFTEDGEKVIEGEATVLVDTHPANAQVEVERLS